jgi:hypothetical protein
MSASWNYLQNGKPQGPVPEEELKQLIGTGQVPREVLVWRPGLAEWTKASQFPELLPAAPSPVLPGAAAPDPAVHIPFEPPRAAVRAVPETSSLEAQAAVAGAMEALRATKPWARFMGVLGAIGIVLMVLVSLLVAFLSRGPFKGMPAPMRIVLPSVYILFGALQIPPVVYLNRYASRIGVLLRSHAPEDLTRALEAQKTFWRYVGIFALVVTCLYGLLILGGVGVAAAAGALRRF